MKLRTIFFFAFITSILYPTVGQDHTIRYQTELSTNVSSGSNAPFWLTTNKDGLQSISNNSSYLKAGIFQDADSAKKISYNFGFELAKSTNYSSELIIQQAFITIYYKNISLGIGMKEHHDGLENYLLSSCGGGTLWSGNARSTPEMSFGLPNYVTVFPSMPWLKVKAEMSYGWLVDNGYQLHTLHTQNGYATVNGFLHRKSATIQLKGKSHWSFNFKGEIDVEFGGKQLTYSNGQLVSTIVMPADLKHCLLAFVPLRGDSKSTGSDKEWYYGNYVGNWQARLNYDLGNSGKLHAYLDNYFEDSSGFWKLNKLDGLWGIEYEAIGRKIIQGIVVEYYQSTDQSGPMDYTTKFYGPTKIKYWAMGGDNYYNHGYYIGWSNYGMGIGSPLVTSPIYNKDNSLTFENNRVKAYHAAMNGYFSNDLSYRVLATYRKGLGLMSLPYFNPLEAFSGMVELNYSPAKVSGLTVSIAGAIDQGKLTGNNYGFNLTLRKKGVFGVSKKTKH